MHCSIVAFFHSRISFAESTISCIHALNCFGFDLTRIGSCEVLGVHTLAREALGGEALTSEAMGFGISGFEKFCKVESDFISAN